MSNTSIIVLYSAVLVVITIGSLVFIRSLFKKLKDKEEEINKRNGEILKKDKKIENLRDYIKAQREMLDEYRKNLPDLD